MCRWLAIAAACALGCGRYGFDDVAGGDATGGSDTATTACRAMPVAAVSLAPQAPVREIAGTVTPFGYALAFRRGDETAVDGIVIAADLASASAPSPIRSSPVEGFNATYLRVVLQWDGAQILGGLVGSGPVFFWKVFPASMGTFTSAVEEGIATPAEPFLATVDGGRYGVLHRAASLALYELDAGGVPTGTATDQNFSASILAAGVVARDASTSIAVIEKDGQGISGVVLASAPWEDFAIDPGGTKPVVSGNAARMFVTYRLVEDVVTRTIDPATLTVGAPRIITRTSPLEIQTALVEGGLRIVLREAQGLRVVADQAGVLGDLEVAGLPAGAPDAYKLVESQGAARVFAAYGDELWTFPICL